MSHTWYMRSHEKKLHRTMEFEYKNKEWRRRKKRAIDDSYLNLLHDHPQNDKSYEMLIGLTIVWKSDGSEISGIYEISGFISIQVKSFGLATSPEPSSTFSQHTFFFVFFSIDSSSYTYVFFCYENISFVPFVCRRAQHLIVFLLHVF